MIVSNRSPLEHGEEIRSYPSVEMNRNNLAEIKCALSKTPAPIPNSLVNACQTEP